MSELPQLRAVDRVANALHGMVLDLEPKTLSIRDKLIANGTAETIRRVLVFLDEIKEENNG